MERRLNPTIVLMTVLVLGLLTTIVRSVGMNVGMMVLSTLYLAFYNRRWRTFGLALLIVFPLALGTWWSFIAFGVGATWHNAWIFASRLYAYIFLGAVLTLTVPIHTLLLSLMQNLKLSATFAYGLLAAFNLLPRIRQQIKIIRYAAQLRGVTYHFWQPQLYFKAILVALNWSRDLAEAMTSHGFSEGYPRTQVEEIKLSAWQWVIPLLALLGYLGAFFVWRPW